MCVFLFKCTVLHFKKKSSKCKLFPCLSTLKNYFYVQIGAHPVAVMQFTDCPSIMSSRVQILFLRADWQKFNKKTQLRNNLDVLRLANSDYKSKVMCLANKKQS